MPASCGSAGTEMRCLTKTHDTTMTPAVRLSLKSLSDWSVTHPRNIGTATSTATPTPRPALWPRWLPPFRAQPPMFRCGRFGTKGPVLQRSTAMTPIPAEPAYHRPRRSPLPRRQTPMRPRVYKQEHWGNTTDVQRAIGVPLRQASKGHFRPLVTAKHAGNQAHTHEFEQFPS